MAVTADRLAEGGVVDYPVGKKAPQASHHREDDGEHSDFKGGADGKCRHVDAKVICTVCECEKSYGRDPRMPAGLGMCQTTLWHVAIPIYMDQLLRPQTYRNDTEQTDVSARDYQRKQRAQERQCEQSGDSGILPGYDVFRSKRWIGKKSDEYKHVVHVGRSEERDGQAK